MNILEQIFSVKKTHNRKVITILGIKFKFKSKDIKDEIYALKKLICSCIDITKIPKATGNLKLMQDSSVAILNRLTEICEKHNIQYWLEGGTLLGYIRHNGFIPWDDDLDITMIRNNYDKLLQILEKEFNKDGFKFARGEIIRLYYKETPGQVDIFPMDFGNQVKPLEAKDKEKFVKNLKKIRKQVKCNWNNLPLQKPTLTVEQINNLLSKRTKLLKNFTPIDKGFLYYGIETMENTQFQIEYNDVFPLKSASFCGVKCNIPNNYEYYLYQIYEDYMAFPDDPYPKHNDINQRLNNKTFKECQELIQKYCPNISEKLL